MSTTYALGESLKIFDKAERPSDGFGPLTLESSLITFLLFMTGNPS